MSELIDIKIIKLNKRHMPFNNSAIIENWVKQVTSAVVEWNSNKKKNYCENGNEQKTINELEVLWGLFCQLVTVIDIMGINASSRTDLSLLSDDNGEYNTLHSRFIFCLHLYKIFIVLKNMKSLVLSK